MALITFKDLPDTTTPITSANLNNNFNELNTKNNYSTDEVVVGVYNEKPLYRKTFIGTGLTANQTQTVAMNISNLDHITNMIGSISDGTEHSISYPLHFADATHLGDASYAASANTSYSNIAIWCGVYLTSKATFDYNIALEYTKSTD